MAENTKIQWCDHTASPWYGCTKCAAGCTNCYAAAMSKRNPGTLGIWGDDGTRVKSKSFIKNLRAWQKSAAKRGVTETVFPSLCDPFEDRPELELWRREMFAVAGECPNIVLLLLTKRPENILRMWPCAGNGKDPSAVDYLRRENVWLLCSIATQADADKNIPELLKCRDLCPVLGVSAEPLIEAVDLSRWFGPQSEGQWLNVVECGHKNSDYGLNWVIVGGESGPKARPCEVAWIHSIIDQCRTAEVPAFCKQLGAFNRCTHDSKGGCFECFPNDLKIREFPSVAARDK